jgi:hypothetical protein
MKSLRGNAFPTEGIDVSKAIPDRFRVIRRRRDILLLHGGLQLRVVECWSEMRSSQVRGPHTSTLAMVSLTDRSVINQISYLWEYICPT